VFRAEWSDANDAIMQANLIPAYDVIVQLPHDLLAAALQGPVVFEVDEQSHTGERSLEHHQIYSGIWQN
jgi:hypothetical protein